MLDIENEANDFVDHLNNVIPGNIKNNDKLYFIFNLLLVKYNERPSMLIDSRLSTDELLNSNLFMSFIKKDPDLSFKILKTETENEELWILNLQNKQLFLNQYGNKHENRGRLLGYPCAGYFEEAYEQESLFVEMFIKDVPVYSYICSISLQNEINAVKKWHRFNTYAMLVGWHLQLNLYIGLL